MGQQKYAANILTSQYMYSDIFPPGGGSLRNLVTLMLVLNAFLAVEYVQFVNICQYLPWIIYYNS